MIEHEKFWLLIVFALGLAATAGPAFAQPADGVDPPMTEPVDANTIIVTGLRSRQVANDADAGILGQRDIIDIPFNIASYTDTLVADTQARSLADVAASDSAVRAAFPRAGYRDVLTIRGFNLFSYNVAFNGIYGIAPKQRYTAEFAERIEILKGPDTFLNGASLGGNAGGAINIVPKRAGDAPARRLSFSYMSDGQIGGHLDLGRRWGGAGETGIRLNALVRSGDLPVANQKESIAAATVAADYRGRDTALSIDAGIQRGITRSPDWSVTLAPQVTSIPVFSSGTGLSQPWAAIRASDIYGLLSAQHAFAPNWQIFGSLGVSKTRTAGLYIQPTALRSNGDFVATINSLPSSGDHLSGQAGVRGMAAIAGTEHEFVAALSQWSQSLKATREIFGAVRSNIFEPVDIPAPSVHPKPVDALHRTAKHGFMSVAFADQIAIASGAVRITIGGRLQGLTSAKFDADTGYLLNSYNRTQFSPIAALVFKPTGNSSIYANYAEALQQGPTAPRDAANYNDIFAPITTRQIELGVKGRWSGISAGLSLFQIVQPSGLLDPATHQFSVSGEQRNCGIELSIHGQVTDQLRVLGGISALDARLIRTAGGQYDGHQAIGSPPYQVNLRTEWEPTFVPQLNLSARLIATGRQFADSANRQLVNGWTRLDAGLRYELFRGRRPMATLRVVAENILNRSYWAAASTGQIGGLSRGAPRQILGSLSFQF